MSAPFTGAQNTQGGGWELQSLLDRPEMASELTGQEAAFFVVVVILTQVYFIPLGFRRE